MDGVWAQEKIVRFHHVDRSGQLKPAAAQLFFEEAAANHAQALGAGRDAMLAKGEAWVLSRMSVRIERRARLGGKILITTWTRGQEKLFAIRDFEISDKSGVCVRARSLWLVLDIEKRRPLRPNEHVDKFPLNEGKDALAGIPAALGESAGLALLKTRAACYSDIDCNGHVNNARYVEWICDIFEPAVIESAGLISYDINYLREITVGSAAGLWLGQNGAEYAVEGRENETCLFRSRILLKQTEIL